VSLEIQNEKGQFEYKHTSIISFAEFIFQRKKRGGVGVGDSAMNVNTKHCNKTVMACSDGVAQYTTTKRQSQNGESQFFGSYKSSG